MAQAKLDLQNLPIPQKVQFLRTVVTKATGNPDATGSDPTVAQIAAAADTLETTSLAAENARKTSETATTVQTSAENAADRVITKFAKFAENKTDGDPARLQGLGFAIRAATTTPIGQLTQPQNLVILVGDNDGELDPDWDSVKGTKTYEVQSSHDPITPTSWTGAAMVTKSKATVSGLATGTKYWFRVRAIGSAGPGPWSDPATKVAP